MNYDLVENYAMKCRLYPSNAQKRAIDDALTAVRVYHNCLIYDIWNNGLHCTEKPKKDSETGETVHFVNLKTAFSAEYKNKLIEEHPIIKACPQAALTTNVGLPADIKKEIDTRRPIEYQKPSYYGPRRQRQSYTYQETLSKIQSCSNPKVLFVTLSVIGKVKLRGWNQKLRFGDEKTDFAEWAHTAPKERITVTVSRDNVGDYFIVFKIKECMKPFASIPEAAKEVGVDVGIKDIAICSDGIKYENRKYKKAEKKHQRALNRRLSRRYGPSNECYRAAEKANRAERKRFFAHPKDYGTEEPPQLLQPSKRYEKTRIQHAKLNRKISRKREAWNHQISREIVENHSLIALESLNVKGMLRNKHLSYALSDAAFNQVLTGIKYKSAWHGRTVEEIGVWTPSSKRCSACGYIYNSNDSYNLKPWSLSIRHWVCPRCGTSHDRDENAARNILFYAKETSSVS